MKQIGIFTCGILLAGCVSQMAYGDITVTAPEDTANPLYTQPTPKAWNFNQSIGKKAEHHCKERFQQTQELSLPQPPTSALKGLKDGLPQKKPVMKHEIK